MGTPIHVKQKKGAKTEAILRFLEAQKVSQPSAIGAHTNLSAKEVSSRISMLAAQGRVAREGEGRRISIRFIGWEIQNSRVVEPEPAQEVPMLDCLWHPVGTAEQLRALADAVAAPTPATPDSDSPSVLGALTTPFVQVLLKAQAEGRVTVRTHCMIDDDDEPAPRSRGGRRVALTPDPVPAATPEPVADAAPEVVVAQPAKPKDTRARKTPPAVKPALAPAVAALVATVPVGVTLPLFVDPEALEAAATRRSRPRLRHPARHDNKVPVQAQL